MKKKSLEDRKKYAAYLGSQEMDKVSFQYTYNFVNAQTEEFIVSFTVHEDERLTPKEAWLEGLKQEINFPKDSVPKRIGSIYEEIIVGVFLENPNEKTEEEESPSAIPTDSPPENGSN